jgi:hypothetical protein
MTIPAAMTAVVVPRVTSIGKRMRLSPRAVEVEETMTRLSVSREAVISPAVAVTAPLKVPLKMTIQCERLTPVGMPIAARPSHGRRSAVIAILSVILIAILPAAALIVIPIAQIIALDPSNALTRAPTHAPIHAALRLNAPTVWMTNGVMTTNGCSCCLL